MFYTALIAMGAGCANESSVNAPDPVAPPCVSGPDDDAESLERLATMGVPCRTLDEPVLVIFPPPDDSQAMVCPTTDGTAY